MSMSSIIFKHGSSWNCFGFLTLGSYSLLSLGGSHTKTIPSLLIFTRLPITSRDSAPRGASRNEPPRDSTPKNGAPEDGAPKNNPPKTGA